MMDGTAIVISPLIALMKDQVDALIDRNIEAAYLNSSLSLDEQNDIIGNTLNGRIKDPLCFTREVNESILSIYLRTNKYLLICY